MKKIDTKLDRIRSDSHIRVLRSWTFQTATRPLRADANRRRDPDSWDANRANLRPIQPRAFTLQVRVLDGNRMMVGKRAKRMATTCSPKDLEGALHVPESGLTK